MANPDSFVNPEKGTVLFFMIELNGMMKLNNIMKLNGTNMFTVQTTVIRRYSYIMLYYIICCI